MTISSQSSTAQQVHISLNVADRLSTVAQRMPQAVAVACPGRGDVAGDNAYATCTFRELDQDANALARGLIELGVKPSTRLVLLVKPGIEFVKLVFALLRSGATMVLVDPGMGRRHLIDCVASTEPEGFVAISRAQAIRTFLRQRFPQAKLNVTVGRCWFWGGTTYRQLLEIGRRSTKELPQTEADATAAIIFTSGSTGPPKGVLYTHRMFETQVEEISRHYQIQPGGFDLSCFPLFGLFNSAMGVTTVFPDMDFARPASADPRKLLTAAHDWKVTQAFASPAVWGNLSAYCLAHHEQIPTLREIFSCGAPVPAEVLQRTLDCADAHAEMHTPYGATESLPIATIRASEVLGETAEQTNRGAGVCVGRKFHSIEWQVIGITDEPIATIGQTEQLEEGEIGELIVRGPQVSPSYLTGREGKIADGDTYWHRMGDVGYFDPQQRFWYCGRKAHRVETENGTLFTIPVEAVFNTHPAVRRSALVGAGIRGKQVPVLIVEPAPNAPPQEQMLEELRELARTHEQTDLIQHFLWHRQLPVDVRHNSKINREQLAEFAAKKLARHSLVPRS